MQPRPKNGYLWGEGTKALTESRRTMEDHAIIELYFKREESAIAQTAEKYGRLCHHIAARILNDHGDAAECVNDTYLALWQAIPPARPGILRAFVARIARNQALSRLRHATAAKRTPEALLSLDELEDILPDTAGFAEREDREVGQWISEFLAGEPEEVRNLFLRKYWFLDSIDTLCRKFGYSESKIKSLLFRTRNKLRHYLSEKGVTV